MDLKRILVGIDGSEVAFKAAGLAGRIAKGANAKLTLAHVVRPVVPAAEINSQTVKDAEKQEMRWARRILDEGAELGRELGIEAETEVLTGPPAETLADFAEAKDLDLVLVGDRGRGAVSRVVVGSFSDRLVDISKRPVLVVR